MKRFVFLTLLFLAAISINAQPSFDLGLKAGINNSKMSLDIDDYNSESILKTHFGAYMRVGLGRFYIQPEGYFSSKGGDIGSDVNEITNSFDYNTIDVPVLLGFKIITKETFSLHAIVGPVFSFITSTDTEGEFSEEYFADNYVGWQYGLGIDIWRLTFDARMEQGGNDIYNYPDFDFKNQLFMVSVGFKIL